VKAGQISAVDDERAEHVIEQLGDPVVITDLDTRIRAWNRAAERAYGMRLDEVRGKRVREVLRTHYFERPEVAAAALYRDGSWFGEVVHRRSDGAALHVLSSVTLLHDGEGRPTGAVAVNHVLPTRQGPGDDLQRHLADAMRAGDTATWSWDPDTGAFEWSDNAAEVHGVAAEVLGHTWDDALAMVHPHDRERIFADASAAVVAVGRFDVEYRIVADDHTTRWMACQGRTLRDDEGEVARVVGTVTDITDRHRVEDTLHATEERLQRVVANAPIVVFAFDAAGRITLAEGAAMPSVGLELVVPGSEVAINIERVLRGESFRADVEYGGAVYDTWYQPLFDEQGAVAGGFGVSTDVTERRRVESELAHQAVHDPLTGLPNRVLFLDRLSQALRRGRRRHLLTAVLFLDLDRFKLVNDSYGHSVGDDVLLVAAERLRALVRPSDTVARFGGDEFVLLCEDLVGELEAVGIAERIVDGLRQPTRVGGVEIYLSTSIGIAIARADDKSPDDVIRDADVAMYRAKERGRARWELFDEGMRDRAVQQLGIRNGLPFALVRDEFRLHYQPAIRLRDGAMRGAEALVRWQHPEYGLIAPAEFIPAAEEAGFMREIGTWVLTEACRQVTRWNRLVRPALTVAVNLSAYQLHEPSLLEDVTRVLTETGTSPADVCLEIAEGALLAETERVIEVLEQLKALGVLLAIDDFGAGQSALGYLRRLPVDILKLDRRLA